MADEKFTFEQAKIRLEEIASEARKKDTSLERSLDLLEEGVRLANICTELVDHTDLNAGVVITEPEGSADAGAAVAQAGEPAAAAAAADGTGVTETSDEPDAEGFDESDDEVVEPPAAGDED